MNKYLYPCFNHWFENNGQVFFYSDPHFDDKEAEMFRKIKITSEEQIKRINSKVGKNDTLVILGDIGNVEWIKKIRAGRKILILGNHDKGVTNYQRKVYRKYFSNQIIAGSEEDKLYEKFLSEGFKPGSELNVIGQRNFYLEKDNKLFDEVYEGCLMLSDNIILSHEPVDFKFAFNIHGHDHSAQDFVKYVLNYYDCDMSTKDLIDNYLDVIKTEKLLKLNVCCEWINFEPINLNKIVKSGVLKNVPNIHRVYLDSIK